MRMRGGEHFDGSPAREGGDATHGVRPSCGRNRRCAIEAYRRQKCNASWLRSQDAISIVRGRSERSAARLAHQSGGLGVPSSNLGAPTNKFKYLTDKIDRDASPKSAWGSNGEAPGKLHWFSTERALPDLPSRRSPAMFAITGYAGATTKPARGKCTQTSPISRSLRRITISWTSEATNSPTTGSRPVS